MQVSAASPWVPGGRPSQILANAPGCEAHLLHTNPLPKGTIFETLLL